MGIEAGQSCSVLTLCFSQFWQNENSGHRNDIFWIRTCPSNCEQEISSRNLDDKCKMCLSSEIGYPGQLISAAVMIAKDFSGLQFDRQVVVNLPYHVLSLIVVGDIHHFIKITLHRE